MLVREYTRQKAIYWDKYFWKNQNTTNRDHIIYPGEREESISDSQATLEILTNKPKSSLNRDNVAKR